MEHLKHKLREQNINLKMRKDFKVFSSRLTLNFELHYPCYILAMPKDKPGTGCTTYTTHTSFCYVHRKATNICVHLQATYMRTCTHTHTCKHMHAPCICADACTLACMRAHTHTRTFLMHSHAYACFMHIPAQMHTCIDMSYAHTEGRGSGKCLYNIGLFRISL